MILSFSFFIVLFSSSHLTAQKPFKNAYSVESVVMPEGLAAQTGGMDFFPDGRMVACFIRGEVMVYELDSKKWSVFADGLQSPLGIVAINDSTVMVAQLSEITKITDTDADGRADLYENISNEFGQSGNYHEFNYGPVKDKEGNIYFALNTASSGGGIRSILQGEFNPLGRDGISGHKQMFSVVPYRGWVMKVTPDGVTHPYASGLRSPNGIGFDLDENLFVTDNQSDWVETSTLYHIKEGAFYGHPASLIWKQGWGNRDPFNMPINELDSMRTKAAVLFPQGIMANSPSQPLVDNTGGKFGPFAGQIFVGEMNRDRVIRVMLEKVGGEFQGACVPFMDGNGLRSGNNRLAFAPDGSLWIGQIKYGGWVGQEGMQKIVFNQEVPMEIQNMNLRSDGFELTFTQPINEQLASNLENYKFRSYYYAYKKKDIDEGIDISTQEDLHNVDIKDIIISEDKKKVYIRLTELKAGYVYELKLNNIQNVNGQPLNNNLICYTLNKLL